MPSLAHYMAQYDHEHESGWNKLLHGVGIPMIFAGIILIGAIGLAMDQSFRLVHRLAFPWLHARS